MSALIDTLIPTQAVERVRDRIFSILGTELAAQAAMGNYVADTNVYLERIVPFQQSEVGMVNVSLATSDYSGQTAIHSPGTYRYFVDAYQTSKTESTGDADSYDRLAMLKLHQLTGICRAIIEDARYNTLGFTPPFISRRFIEKIIIADPNNRDMAGVVMSRITVVVNVNETVALKQGVEYDGLATIAKICCTDLGYLWDGNTGAAPAPSPTDPCDSSIPSPSSIFARRVLISIAAYKVKFLTTSASTYVFNGTVTGFNPDGKDLRGMKIDELYMGGFMWAPAYYNLNSVTGEVSYNNDIVPNDYCVIEFRPMAD